MDSTAITVACIVAGVPAIASIVTSIVIHTKTRAIIEQRIATLEEKVDKHNNLVERTYKCESDIRVLQFKVDTQGIEP